MNDSEKIPYPGGDNPDLASELVLGEFTQKFKEDARERIAGRYIVRATEAGATNPEEVIEYTQAQLTNAFNWHSGS